LYLYACTCTCDLSTFYISALKTLRLAQGSLIIRVHAYGTVVCCVSVGRWLGQTILTRAMDRCENPDLRLLYVTGDVMKGTWPVFYIASVLRKHTSHPWAAPLTVRAITRPSRESGRCAQDINKTSYYLVEIDLQFAHRRVEVIVNDEDIDGIGYTEIIIW